MLLSVMVAVMVSALNQNPQNGSVGRCAWNKIPEQIRKQFVTNSALDSRKANAILEKNDAAILQAVQSCAQGKVMPVLLARAAVSSQATQEFVVQHLQAQGVSRAALKEAWRQAPEASRQCTRANAAKVFGLMNEPCPDPKAPLWFLERFSVDPATQGAQASLLLYFMNSYAQSEWAEAFIGRFLADN